MSAQDILPDLQHSVTYRFRRRILFVTLLILVLHYLAWRVLERAGLEPIGPHSFASNSRIRLPAPPPPEHLLKLVNQRQSSYRAQDSLVPVTAIIVLLNDPKERLSGNLELALRFLVKYPFVKEVIIWNDDVMASGADMKAEDFVSMLKSDPNQGSQLPAIRLLNSPGGLREMSSHMACSLAKFETCYHIGEGELNLNLDTLYTKYVESNSKSDASITNHVSSVEYLAEDVYEIHQPAHHLQSGITSRLSRGSLTSKYLSVRYFQQLSTAMLPPPPASLGTSMSRTVLNDIQFSIWLNRQSRKLVTTKQSLALIDRNQLETQLDPEFIQSTYQRLNETIRSSDPFLVPDMFPRPLLSANPIPEVEIGVASAWDDRSMLITNLEFSSDWPLAIDGDISTCWTSLLDSQEQNFVGLNLVKSAHVDQFSMIGKLEIEDWELESYSSDSHRWITIGASPTVIAEETSSVNKYVYDLSAAGLSVKKVRLIRRHPLIKTSDPNEPLRKISVCGWTLNQDWIT